MSANTNTEDTRPRSPGDDCVMVSGSRIVDGDLREILSAALPWSNLAGKTVLVTGASGMIPAYVVYTLLALNDRGMGIKVLGLARNAARAKTILASVMDRPDFSLIRSEEHTSELQSRPHLVCRLL